MKNILITGVSGYLGPYLIDSLAMNNDFRITGLYNAHSIDAPEIELIQCNLTDFRKLQNVFDTVKPDIVYHLASVTPTRIKGQGEDYIEFFNSEVTRKIAELCTIHNSLLLYTSTDLVYEGGSNITEDSSPLNPLNIYARTKLLGEDAVSEVASSYLILRLALVYGFSRSSYRSFFDECYISLKAGNEVKAFYDQFRNPLYIEDAAEILSSMSRKFKTSDTINLCGSETLSRYLMCVELADTFGFDKNLLKPASCEEFKDYPMVKNLALSNEKLKKYGFVTSSYKTNLAKSMKFKY